MSTSAACKEIMNELAQLGSENVRKIFKNHGAPDNFFGVKVGDMKPIQKRIKKNYLLAKELYSTGNSDAMYLAGLIADEKQMTREDLQQWAENATWYMLGEFTVAWVAAESAYGQELALKWIESDRESIQCAGWSAMANICALKADAELDLKLLESLLQRVEKTIHTAQNRARYCMNSFVIAVGSYVMPLSSTAKAVAENIGKVQVNMGNTACKVPYAPEYIEKALNRGPVKKKKTVRC